MSDGSVRGQDPGRHDHLIRAAGEELTTDPRDVLDLLDRTAETEHGGGLEHVFHLPGRPPGIVALPDSLPRVIVTRLARAGVDQLWSHQAEAYERARAGEHVVISTGTASGKSLAYQLPVLEQLVTDEHAVGLYLAPTKALAHDQLRAFRGFSLPQVRAAVIDGDTPRTERDAIQRTANLLLTNPDLLHHSLLPNHRHWAELLSRLAYVIVDESHVARGVFGGHVALILRRLRRIADRYSADPTFLLASATIGNPAAHASALTGLEVTAIERDGSPRGPLDLGVWVPPYEDRTRRQRVSLLREVGELLARFVAAGVQTLVFTNSRKGAEVVALHAQQRLTDQTDDEGQPLATRIAAYRAGYLPEDRRELEGRLKSGALRGVAATQALELGIDISGLDAVILAGWPGTFASFWQRLGRAGRGGDSAVGVYVPQQDPLDQYLVSHPNELVERPPEDAVVDPDNPYLLGPHLRCAAQEAALQDEELTAWFGDRAPALIADDVERGILRARAGRTHWISRRRASAAVNLRSAGGDTVRIVDASTGALVGDVDEARAHRQLHLGAIYLHQGETYRVASLDLQQHLAVVEAAPTSTVTTRARVDTDVSIIEKQQTRSWQPVSVALGRVDVTTQVTGYDVLRIGSDAVIDRIALDLPPIQTRTVAVWYTIPPESLDAVGLSRARVPGSLHAAEHAAIGLLPLIALCDRWDLGGLSTLEHPDTGYPTVFIYDGYPGGAGLAERSFTRFAEHVQLTRSTIDGCPCPDGCPRCVQSPKCGNGNDPLDKRGAVTVLDLLLSAIPQA